MKIKHCLISGHWQLSHMTGWDLNPCHGERQLVVSGKGVDQSAIRAVYT